MPLLVTELSAVGSQLSATAGKRRTLPILGVPADEPVSVGRRDFLKVMGAAGAATATLGCAQEEVEKLIPYLVSPDQTVPGVSSYYATTCRECSAGCGVIAETRDGRTIMLAGNPDHPLNRGALCARGHAGLQGLYNPDRYRGPMIRRGNALVRTTWDEALRVFTQKLGEARGRGAVFVNQHESGSFPALLDEWLAARGLPPHISYDGQTDFAAVAANRQSFQVSWPRYDFRAARLVVSFGADFLDSWGPSVTQQLDWAEARSDFARAPRLIYVGPRRSLTGLNADEWIDCFAGSELAILRMLAGELTVAQAERTSGVEAARLQRLRAEFAAATPNLVLGGGSMDVALAANALNVSRGNVGSTVKPGESATGYDGMASPAEARAAFDRMRAGAVSLFMVRNADPVYALGKANAAADALTRVPFKVSFSSIMDETSELCDLVLPDHHSLEQWGDAEPVRGVISLQQPTMDPVFDTRATADVLLSVGNLAGAAPSYRDWLIARLPGGARALTAALPKGIVAGSLGGRSQRSVPAARTAPSSEQTGNMTLVVYQHPLLGDGRGANKPWLQEIPDPATKICWQTVAEMHPRTAARLGVENGDHVSIGTAGGSLTLPVYLYIGVRPDTVAVATGRGHRRSGRYASAGSNAFDLLSGVEDRSGALVFTETRAQVEKAPGHQQLVTTEGSARQHGRGIGQAVAAAQLRDRGIAGAEPAPEGDHAEAAHHVFPGDAKHDFLPGLRSPIAADAQGALGHPFEHEQGMYSPKHWSGMAKRRWAMVVDLAKCTGCSACVSACYAENNIPTVGADWQGAKLFPDKTGFGANILRGREMAWIRLERYFEGGEDDGADFDTRFVPMMCQHCGNAPCEPVCPVYATYHAPDGLNVQVYNRCVGTRYCSNNCPYKVRYFNWFGYGEPHRPQYAFPEPLNWQLNPDVTVRGKGVMEKCTFCVQRIREAETRASVEGREMAPNEFTTACAQACPSRAITFGDAADDRWSVAQLAADQRAYHVFEELNTYTAVVYLKKVLHPSAHVASGGSLPPTAPGTEGAAH